MTQTYRATAPGALQAPCGTEDFCDVIHAVVHGSRQPLEWLKLTIDPEAHYKTTATTFGPFAWQRMPQPQL